MDASASSGAANSAETTNTSPTTSPQAVNKSIPVGTQSATVEGAPQTTVPDGNASTAIVGNADNTMSDASTATNQSTGGTSSSDVPKSTSSPVNAGVSAGATTAGANQAGSTAIPQSTLAPASQAAPEASKQLRVEDALNYLDKVKQQFQGDPRVYNKFLEIMKQFKAQTIDTPGVIQRVSNLFRGHTDLILGFNTFLPPGFKIEAVSDAVNPSAGLTLAVRTPQGHLSPMPAAGMPQVGMGLPNSTGMMSGGVGGIGQPGQAGAVIGGQLGGPHPQTGPGGYPPRYNEMHMGPGGAMAGVGVGVLPHMPRGIPVPMPGMMAGPPGSVPMGMAMGMGGLVPPGTPLDPTSGLRPPARPAQQLVRTGPGVPPNVPQAGAPGGGASGAGTGAGAGAGANGAGNAAAASQPIDFDNAIGYLTKIKRRFSNDPQTYKAFLDILHTYQKHERSIKDVLERVSELFKDHQDLLNDFTYFLPDSVQHQAKQRFQQPVADTARRIEGGRGGAGGRNAPSAYEGRGGFEAGYAPNGVGVGPGSGGPSGVGPGMVGGRRVVLGRDREGIRQSDRLHERDYVARQDEERARGEVYSEREREKERALTRQRERASIGMGPGKSGRMQVIARRRRAKEDETRLTLTPSEREFFSRMKSALGSRESWVEFLKLLDLYAAEVLTRTELVTLVSDMFHAMGANNSSNAALVDRLKSFLANRGILEGMTQEDIWYSMPIGEVNLSNCPRSGMSYRALPEGYPILTCSERGRLEQQVLNDTWVSIPTGSEDFSFKVMRKNQFEYALFAAEDEQYEVDMVVENNASTIRVLEPLADEIEALKKFAPGVEWQFRLDRRSLGVLHLRSIARVYGDWGNEVLELLRKNPGGAIPIILHRLKQKDEEWRRRKRELSVTWKDVMEKNYKKSLDHRSFYFKQREKVTLGAKSLLQEMRTKVDELESCLAEYLAQGEAALLDRAHAPTSGAPGANGDEMADGTAPEAAAAASSAATSLPNANQPPRINPNDLSTIPPALRSKLRSLAPVLHFPYHDIQIHQDAYALLAYAVEKSSTVDSNEKTIIADLWRNFFIKFFQFPAEWLHTPTLARYAYGVPSALTFPAGTTHATTVSASAAANPHIHSHLLSGARVPGGAGGVSATTAAVMGTAMNAVESQIVPGAVDRAGQSITLAAIFPLGTAVTTPYGLGVIDSIRIVDTGLTMSPAPGSTASGVASSAAAAAAAVPVLQVMYHCILTWCSVTMQAEQVQRADASLRSALDARMGTLAFGAQPFSAARGSAGPLATISPLLSTGKVQPTVMSSNGSSSKSAGPSWAGSGAGASLSAMRVLEIINGAEFVAPADYVDNNGSVSPATTSSSAAKSSSAAAPASTDLSLWAYPESLVYLTAAGYVLFRLHQLLVDRLTTARILCDRHYRHSHGHHIHSTTSSAALTAGTISATSGASGASGAGNAASTAASATANANKNAPHAGSTALPGRSSASVLAASGDLAAAAAVGVAPGSSTDVETQADEMIAEEVAATSGGEGNGDEGSGKTGSSGNTMSDGSSSSSGGSGNGAGGVAVLDAVTAAAQDRYQHFLTAAYALIDGSMDNSRYEDECRDLMATGAYLLFTLDKLISATVKTLVAFSRDIACRRLVALWQYTQAQLSVAKVTSRATEDYKAQVRTILAGYRANVASILVGTADRAAEECFAIQYSVLPFDGTTASLTASGSSGGVGGSSSGNTSAGSAMNISGYSATLAIQYVGKPVYDVDSTTQVASIRGYDYVSALPAYLSRAVGPTRFVIGDESVDTIEEEYQTGQVLGAATKKAHVPYLVRNLTKALHASGVGDLAAMNNNLAGAGVAGGSVGPDGAPMAPVAAGVGAAFMTGNLVSTVGEGGTGAYLHGTHDAFMR